MDIQKPRMRGAADRLSQFARTLPVLGSPASYIAASLAFAVFILAKPALDIAAGQSLPPFITFYPAVVVAALLGGPRIGVAAAIATLLIAWWFVVPPTASFAVQNRATLMAVVIYAVAASFIGVLIGFARVAFDRVAASETERDQVARESVHRIKNLIAVVQAVAAKVATETSTVDRFQALLRSRLMAIGHAQDVLIRRDWQEVDLESMIKSALEPFLYNPGLEMKPGPYVSVPAQHVSGLCMALYELCTNAMKYGALAGGKGPVKLTWRIDHGAAILSWDELLPAPAMKETTGFGSALVRNALARAPGTSVRYDITPMRVEAEFRWPAEASN